MIEKWPDFKDRCIVRKNLAIQLLESETEYQIWAYEGPDKYECTISKLSPPESNQVDFEDNWKSKCNWATGVRSYPFASGDFDFLGDGMFDTCLAGQVKEIDYEFTEDLYVNGGMIVLEGSVLGDWIEVHVIHPVYGTVKTYIKKRYVPSSPAGSPSPVMEVKTPYAGFIPAGLKLRFKYHSTGIVPVKIGVNYDLHKAI